jgi:hypothetical protein
LVTSSSLCPFDVDPSTEDVSDFRLIFTPDQSIAISKLYASNPGQFVYNVLLVGGLPDGSLDINIPYPFVTQGAMPVHVYDSVTVDPSGCFTPGNEITSQFTIEGVPVTESPATINVSGPYTGLVYVWVHLDYGLKKSTGYSKVYDMQPSCNLTLGLTDNDADGNIDVCDNDSYEFSNSATNSDTIWNKNVFKRNPGIGGTLLGSYANDPIPNVKVQIYDSTGTKLLATVYTDEDGWYMWQYKYTGKSTTFLVKTLKLLQRVTMKSNGFVLVNFTVPQM